MTFHSFRRAVTGTFLALAGALLLNSCGGGGAASDSNQGNITRILPENSTVYAGVPVTMAVVGGRAPYVLVSSDQVIFPVPNTHSGSNGGFFTVIPNNPGVVDTGLPTGSLPIRTVTLQARDATGLNTISTVRVAQNFLTGYGVSLTPTNCIDPVAPATACAGGTTAARLQAVFGGQLYGNQQFRLEVVRGNFSLRQTSTGQVSNSILVNSDHTGTVLGFIEVPAGVPRQLAVLRVVHVPTGVYADQVFVIDGATIPGSEPITAIPNAFTFTGATTTQCGTGIGDFLVFGGVPPYTATSTNLLVSVSPTQSTTNPGRFTVSVSNPTICVSDGTVVVTDSLGNRTTVTVTTAPGTTAPPDPTPITIAPTTITLTCGVTGSVSVVGGVGPLSVTSSHPRVTAVVSGTTLSITRAAGDGTAVFTTGATIAVTDGTQIATVAVTVPANCP